MVKDDKVSAYTSWYNIIANVDDRNVLPEEQTSACLEAVTILIQNDYRVGHRFEPAILSSMEKCQ
jgi:hypothetical protein